MRRVCVALLMLLVLAASAWAAEGDYGRYSIVGGMKGSKLADSVQITGTDTPEIYRELAYRPPYYVFEVPSGDYEVVVHYLAPMQGEKDAGSFSVELDGQEVIAETACFIKPKKMPETATLEAKQVKFSAKATDGMLKVRFPRRYDQIYEIAAIEVLGKDFSIRANGQADRDFTDSQGRLWKRDRPIPMPMPTIQLDKNDKTNEWVEIADEMIRKLRQKGVEPVPKWKGNYTRHSNGMFYDRSGHVYVNFAGVGIWEYGGPGGTLERVDEGRYTSVFKGESVNPYGPGFVLVCSHGYNPKESYQLLSWDGTTMETWALDGDVGACDWQQDGTPKLIFWKPRHNNILVISEDGGKTRTEVEKKNGIANVGALGNGVLVYTMGGREDKPEHGIYRSEDKGKTWEKVFDMNLGGNVNCSPILSYKERAYLHSDKGLLKSVDRGKTWRLIPDSPAFTFSLQAGKDGDQHMLGLSEEGIWETKDQGESWTKVTDAPPTPDKQKWVQSHRYYDFSWDCENDVIYCAAPDLAWRYVRR
ncbi:MAG: hypothetical protein ACLFUS_02885 [Candidatus Sumerlaeia bacterium]